MSKESGLRVRVEEGLRKAFIEACRLEDQTASQEIRKFMRDYVKAHSNQQQFALFADGGLSSQQSDMKKR